MRRRALIEPGTFKPTIFVPVQSEMILWPSIHCRIPAFLDSVLRESLSPQSEEIKDHQRRRRTSFYVAAVEKTCHRPEIRTGWPSFRGCIHPCLEGAHALHLGNGGDSAYFLAVLELREDKKKSGMGEVAEETGRNTGAASRWFFINSPMFACLEIKVQCRNR